MLFNTRCEHLITKPPNKIDSSEGSKDPTLIRYFCNAQRDEINNPIPIVKCLEGCPFFEAKTI